ncbi:hypothetical protein KKF84_17785 [Myxococcota bacterium]|nr:hypothetical protein [Myxococcota bacterium]
MRALATLSLIVMTLLSVVACVDDGAANNSNTNNNTNTTNNTNSGATLFGTLEVTAVTVGYNGSYGPHNVAVIWIQKPDGTFVQTLYLAQRFYGIYLSQWTSVSQGDVTDAVTEASRMNQGTMTGTWNLQGVEPGEYEFWAEFTEENRAGKYDYGVITLDGSAVTVTATPTPAFSLLEARFTPAAR